MIGFYIHIPYCSRICTYCDFYKRVETKENIDKYIDRLVKDIDLVKKDYDTIFIGGGTPSIIGLKNFEKIFKKLKTNVYEFTIECNPNDVTKDLLELFKKNNVSRISLGVQSFNNNLLENISRDHTKKIAVEAIKLVKEYGFILNVDMLHSIPNQTIVELKKDLLVIKKLKIDSISYYSLILEEKTILYHKYLKGEYKENHTREIIMGKIVESYLKKLNYYKYENSNYTKKYESLHNKLYWNNSDYYAAGSSAVSKTKNRRKTIIKNINKYINSEVLEYSSIEELNNKDIMFEEIMLNLRYYKGLNINSFKAKYNKDVFEVFNSLKKLKKNNYLEVTKTRIKLTKKGFNLQNFVLLTLLEDIENE